eukprot:TRINITY_DN82760_c0_g1_i1.p1 TRINITY_DN82760_c0_g1~~TRINITY_DN82760_c0_g1_i1.p1  ORF type:complete len:334 (+),score=65.06 TRINITY_DN82760_c0_g1_i1:35-1036(+)
MIEVYNPRSTGIQLPDAGALVLGGRSPYTAPRDLDQPPLAPPSLLDGFPEPERVEARKTQYLKSLEEQVRQNVTTLTQQHQANLEYLRAKNEQQKRQALATIDQELLKAEMELDRRHDEQLLGLQQAAMRKKFDVAKEAGAITLEFHSRQTQEKLQYLDYELHRKFFEAASGQTRQPQASLPPAPAQSRPMGGSVPYTAEAHEALPGGTLYVSIQAGHNLMNRDTGLLGDVSDPYVVVKLGKQEHSTPVIDNDLNPVWNDGNSFTFSVGHEERLLDLEVMNSNIFRNDSLGRTTLDFRSLAADVWHQQRDLLKNGDKGELSYCVYFRPASPHG